MWKEQGEQEGSRLHAIPQSSHGKNNEGIQHSLAPTLELELCICQAFSTLMSEDRPHDIRTAATAGKAERHIP
eukprot:217401-Chlamydomonas_euryale.AAC.2